MRKEGPFGSRKLRLPHESSGAELVHDLVSLIQRRTTRPVVGLGPHLLDRSGAIRAQHRLVQ